MKSYIAANALLHFLGTASAADYALTNIDTCIAGIENQTSIFPGSAGTSAVGPESSTLESKLTETQNDSGSFSFSLTTGSLTNTIVTSMIPTTTLNPTAFSTSSSIPELTGRLIILQVQPFNNRKRQTGERRSGGFVGPGDPEVCTFATVFNLAQGQLFNGGLPIYYSGEEYKQLIVKDDGGFDVDSITTTFETNDRILVFRNSGLPNGQAGFCQDASGEVYLTFTASPIGCVEVTLAVYDVLQCQDGHLVGVSTSTISRTVSSTSVIETISSGSVNSKESTATGNTEVSTSASSEIVDPTSTSNEAIKPASSASTSLNSQPSSTPTGFTSSSTSLNTKETALDTSTTIPNPFPDVGSSTAEATTTVTTVSKSIPSSTDETTTTDADETTTATIDKITTTSMNDTTTAPVDDTTTGPGTTTGTIADTTTDLTMTTSSAPEPNSCPLTSNPYTDEGSTYDISCGSAITGGSSIGVSTATNFQQCIFFCSQAANCAAIQYERATNACSGFSSFSGTTRSSGFDIAVKQATTTTTT
ncbi:hypothetical protein HG530_014752 [Fusarium avenaceum]|nr:hypothetical protein HG530_014752 [Fusarium avenaceum]